MKNLILLTLLAMTAAALAEQAPAPVNNSGATYDCTLELFMRTFQGVPADEYRVSDVESGFGSGSEVYRVHDWKECYNRAVGEMKKVAKTFTIHNLHFNCGKYGCDQGTGTGDSFIRWMINDGSTWPWRWNNRGQVSPYTEEMVKEPLTGDQRFHQNQTLYK